MITYTFIVEAIPVGGITQEWLNGFGAQGWQLVAINTTFNAVVIFQKPSA